VLSARYLGSREIDIQEAQPEPPLPGQVQVEVAYVGICGTDMHVLQGEMDDRVRKPAILGHEMSGVIAALGDGVTGWQVGDQVTAIPLDWDGTCPACRAGNHYICHHLRVKGVDLPGAL
jgi:(R,R)-butanediol dehydrogenase / meso-butanediol dehydrogenase / diacetyl reductase